MTEDSELGDYDPQNDSEEEAQNQATVPHLRNSRSAHDRDIRPGDPVRDLWGGSWLIAVRKKADTVSQYDAEQPDTQQSLLDYEGSIGVGATESDTVWSCFYLNQNNTLAGGRSGPYDFPESRICRYAYEDTDGYKRGRFQDHLRDLVLEDVVRSAISLDADDSAAIVLAAIADAFGKDTATLAAQMNDAGHLAGGGDG